MNEDTKLIPEMMEAAMTGEELRSEVLNTITGSLSTLIPFIKSYNKEEQERLGLVCLQVANVALSEAIALRD